MIGDILASPSRYNGQTVEIVGFFRGWDLLDEASGRPPVTRSDWVIKDDSGAIYVTGLLPSGLNPASPEDTDVLVRLKASVVNGPNGPYLAAEAVDRVGP